MGNDNRKPDNDLKGEPVGLDHIDEDDAADRATDVPSAIDLPVEQGDANSQPG